MVLGMDRSSAASARASHHSSNASAWGVTSSVTDEEKTKEKACAFWFLGLCCLCGCHRCYLRNYCTGTAWCLTLGCLGICQVYDVCCMEYLVNTSNGRR